MAQDQQKNSGTDKQAALAALTQRTQDEQAAQQTNARAESRALKKQALEQMQKQFNPATGEARPVYANGTSPNRAINESPLTVEQRARLSVGNKAGRLKFLRREFDDAQLDKTGNFVVKQGEQWKRVDAEGLGDADAWEITKSLLKGASKIGLGQLTGGSRGAAKSLEKVVEKDPIAKEFVSDIADILPESALVGGTLATGGLSGLAAVGGGVEFARTSLGRLAGTYEATPEQQIQDIGDEIMWNVLIPGGGKLIKAGDKMTGRMASTGLKKSAKTLGEMSQRNKNTTAAVVGSVTGVGDEAILRNLDRPKEIARWIALFTKNATPEFTALQAASKQAAKETSRIARLANKQMQRVYERGMETFKRKIPEGFQFNPSQVMKPVKDNLVNRGVAVVDDAGNLKLNSVEELARLSGQDAAISELANNKAARRVTKELLDTLNNFSKQKVTRGKEAADALRTFDKSIRDQINKTLRPKLHSDNVRANEVGFEMDNLLKSVDGSLDQHVAGQLKGASAEALKVFRATKQNWSKLKKEVDPVLAAFKKEVRGKDDAAAQLMNKLFSSPGRSPMDKEALAVIERSLATESPALRASIARLKDMRAASAVMPAIGGLGSSIGIVGAAGALGAGVDPAFVAISLGASPRVLGSKSRTLGRIKNKIGQGGTQAMAEQGFRGLSVMNAMRASGDWETLTKNEQAFENWLKGTLAPRNIEQQSELLLESLGISQPTGAGGSQ